MKKMQKAIHRLWRICTGRKGMYCKYGTGTKFKSGVFTDESTEIGKYTFLGRYTTVTKAKIGNYCSIAPFVTIGPGEHNINGVTTSERINNILYNGFDSTKEDVIIENDVWIGSNVVVLRGVHIGTGAVLAAGAVVNRDVPPYSVVAGVPARIIKYRKSEEEIEKILKSKWWNYSPKEAIDLLKKEKII